MAILEDTYEFILDQVTEEQYHNGCSQRAKENCFQNYLNLQTQRENELFCDVTIQVEDEKFPAHKSVLAASSDYFFKMFTTDMKEKAETTINIETVTPRAMREILSGIYTGDISFEEENIGEIVHAASLMQLKYVLKECKNYMSYTLQKSNCCLFLELAMLYSLDGLTKEANAFFLKHFDDVSTESDFLKLKVEKVEEILASDELVTREESFVFQFVTNWVNKDVENRRQHFPQLFKHIRLQFIPIEYVVNTIRKNELVRETHECRDLVEDAFEHHVTPTVATAQKHRKSFVPEPDSVMLLPYQQSYQAVRGRDKYGLAKNAWHKFYFDGFSNTAVPRYCAVATDYPITVLCGGINGKETQTINQVMRFDCVRWIKMPNLVEARCGAAAVFLNGKIIVFGGEKFPVSRSATFKGGQMNPDASNFSESFEIFEKKWETGKFPIKRSFFSAQAVNEKIYLIGGYKLSDASNIAVGQQARCKAAVSTVIVYNPAENTWKKDGCMKQARADFGCALLRNSTIVVVGGYDANGSVTASSEFRVTSQSNVWTVYTNMPYSFISWFSACYLKNKLFVAEAQNQYMYTKKTDENKAWQQENSCPASGILIPFSSWYCWQEFAKVKAI